jgi:excinuclease ABC subunit A
MIQNKIIIQGAREHNLKNINVEIPRDRFVVITGLSGSGKSTLAFDTIYAEGQRRYVESLSAYARQFLGQMDKPNVDSIDGLSPAIAIEQKSTHRNPRSTVGTITEIYDYLRLLYARVGKPFCPQCQRPIENQSLDQIVNSILSFPEGSKIQILAPMVKGRKGEHLDIIEKAQREGFGRIRMNGEIISIEEARNLKLNKNQKHSLDIVIDRLVIKDGLRSRLSDSVQIAMKLGNDSLLVLKEEPRQKTEIASAKKNTQPWHDILYSANLHCPHCDLSFPKLEPRSFSFNSPYGACTKCDGLGVELDFDPDLIVPNTNLSIDQGAIKAWGSPPLSPWYRSAVLALEKHLDFSARTPWKNLSARIQKVLLHGTSGEKINYKWEREDGSFEFRREFEGIMPNLRRRYRETKSENMREEFHKFITPVTCDSCRGNRLKPFPGAVRFANKTITEITAYSMEDLNRILSKITLNKSEELIAREVIKEILNRVNFLLSVGLSYITLDRQASTLSGGEASRIRLATQIGSGLMGVLYILDEPSIGLHQRDNDKLISTLNKLRDIGNTVLVVEHDFDTIMNSDYVLDLGPGAGVHGGEIVAQGTPKQIQRNSRSLTGQYLCGKKKIETPHQRRKGNGAFLLIEGAEENNLKKINVKIPLKKLICITGVSGSGKSTLINEILYKRAARILMKAYTKEGKCRNILGLEHLDKVIDIDQSPIGRTPRSNPATYTGLFTPIRELFSKLPESKIRGFQPGRFSFNVKGGRCESCEGAGIKKIEMHFLPDVFITCEVCHGKRFNQETLEVRYKGKSIYDVLEMNVEEALSFFENIPIIKNKLELLNDVGLSYIKLGQAANTLSGGEAQRVKLSSELSKRATGNTLYILDEPTTGLHFEDINKLLLVLDRLLAQGNTIIVIEHNMDVIKYSDWIIDLGPEGGQGGGQVICEGTPEEVAENKNSYTGLFLKKTLAKYKT